MMTGGRGGKGPNPATDKHLGGWQCGTAMLAWRAAQFAPPTPHHPWVRGDLRAAPRSRVQHSLTCAPVAPPPVPRFPITPSIPWRPVQLRKRLAASQEQVAKLELMLPQGDGNFRRLRQELDELERVGWCQIGVCVVCGGGGETACKGRGKHTGPPQELGRRTAEPGGGGGRSRCTDYASM